MRFPTLSLALGVLLVPSVSDADDKRPAKKNAAKPAPALRSPQQIDRSLPNVLLIGDSISLGYHAATAKQLSGEANVFRPNTNCGPSTRGLAEIDKWIGDRKWDVIHWNHGLHDLKYLGPNGENLADPEADTSHQQVPPDEYKANLAKLAKRIKATGAKVIFCETTPVPQGAKGRVVGDSKRYNDAAREVMAEIGGIDIDPLYEVAMRHAETQKPANVHYTAQGSTKLAEQVAKVIRQHL